ncbi:MAG: hypothetical protein V3W31_08935 [Thermodesulfobacteriota bacterium]
MDILILSRDFLINLIYSLPAGLTSYILRVGFLLAMSSTVLFAAWMYLPWRTVLTQVCIAVTTITFSLYTPVERCREVGKEFLTFAVLIAICCMVFLPGKLSFCLTPRLGDQLRLKRIIVYAIWAGLILQIITGR